jgi:MFS family permease
MALDAYRTVLRHPDARRVLLLGTVIRIPMWAANVILTLHVVTHLHRSYGEAGTLVGIATVALALSSPWRGRRLDRIGLRRTIAPSLVVLTVCWSIAPFTGYWPLLVLSAVGGLFEVPTFTAVRQALMHAVGEQERRAALSVDSVLVEVSFMIGPALGVLLATYVPTPWALFGCQFASIAGSAALWLADPPMRHEDAGAGDHDGVRSWLTPSVLAVMIMAGAATIVLSGTDVGVVAMMRHLHHQPWIGWELALWGLGSAIGGLVYGAVHRTVPLVALMSGLAVTTLPLAVSDGAAVAGVLLFLAGLFCAPSITASIDLLSRLVPDTVRGEALGWHGASMTAGSAVGAPVAGFAIDHLGWAGAFVVTALLALVTALAGAPLLRRPTRPSTPAPVSA